MAKSGNQVTIYPADLTDAEMNQLTPYTVADLIGVATSFNIPYLLATTPPSFTFNPPIIN